MDFQLYCKDIEVNSYNHNTLDLRCVNVDTDCFEEREVCRAIPFGEYISHHDDPERLDMLETLIEEIDITEVLSHYTAEELLEHVGLDDVLDYFQANLINHV